MTKKKNICITINSLARGGAEKQSLLLAKALQPFHNTTVVIINNQPIHDPHLAFINKENIDHIFLAKNPLKKLTGLIGFLKNQRIDIIFSFLPTDTLWAAICGKMAGVPYIFGGIRNSHIPYVKFAALRFANNFFLNYTIANNNSAYDVAVQFGFKKKVMVIANGIEMRPIVDRPKINMKCITIISVGRLVKQKAYETALRAIFELRNTLDTTTSIQYIIVGEGPEEKNIVADIEKYGLLKEVKLIIDPTKIYALLETSDIYLCTSTFEGISNSIMEAMNCAMPVVATEAGDNSRLVLDGKTGFVTTIGSYHDIARHLGSLVQSPSLRKQLGRKGYDHLLENFSYQAFQKRYLNIIENVGALQIRDGEMRLQQKNLDK